MTTDYIPAKDADLLAWSANFNGVITAAPASYGLTAPQATAYDALDTIFIAAYAAAVTPGTRTPVTVAAKDVARSNLVASARQLGQIARQYPGITPSLLADAGLTVPDPIPSPIPAPSTQPVLDLVSSTSLTQTLRFKDSVLVNPRSKPPGVTGLQVFRKIGTTPPVDIDDCTFAAVVTRVPFVMTFDGADAGKNAYYIARWMNAKGQVGPQSGQLVVTIAA